MIGEFTARKRLGNVRSASELTVDPLRCLLSVIKHDAEPIDPSEQIQIAHSGEPDDTSPIRRTEYRTSHMGAV